MDSSSEFVAFDMPPDGVSCADLADPDIAGIGVETCIDLYIACAADMTASR